MTDTRKIALITGGSRGLGRSTALHLARKGIDTVLTWHSGKREADSAVAEIEGLGGKAAALQLDTSCTGGFEDFAERLKTVLKETWDRDSFDCLVNNAGTGVFKSFAETTEDEFDQLVNIHFKGVFFLTQRLLPLIEDGGRIVNISSGLARFALPGYAAYGAMKGAIEVLTRYQAKELGSRQITVNAVAPGAVETDFGGGVVRDNADVNRHIAAATAMGRVGLPDDIGGAISSLLAGDFDWMTAQRIEVSGGQNL
ncbi:SDR family oxidoreductase [uncultured Roseibium sp.]|uniref:SDR family NAD(P)-dependent oxidoreductase n=1 Tax=uncultured Roseibium sp. TaxID=1936171 RepID=UPI003216409F